MGLGERSWRCGRVANEDASPAGPCGVLLVGLVVRLVGRHVPQFREGMEFLMDKPKLRAPWEAKAS